MKGVKYSPNGQVIAFSDGQSILVRDAQSHQDVKSINTAEQVTGFVFHPDSKKILSFHDDGSLRLWDCETAQEIKRYNPSKAKAVAAAISPNGRTIASAHDDGALLVLDASTGKQRWFYFGHSNNVASTIAFSPDGRTLAADAQRPAITLWDAERGVELGQLNGHQRRVVSIRFTKDGQKLLSMSWDDSVRLWDLKKRTLIAQSNCASDVTDIAYLTPNEGDVLIADRTGNINRCSLRDEQPARVVTHYKFSIRGIALSPDGNSLLVGGLTNEYKILDLRSGKDRSFSTPRAVAVNAAINKDASQIALGARDGVIRRWDLDEARQTLELTGPAEGVRSVSFFSDGVRLASAANDGSVWTWEAAGRKLMPTASQRDDITRKAALSPDDKLLAVFTRPLRLVDSASGDLVRPLNGHQGTVWSASFGAGGGLLASGGEDSSVRVWDVKTGAELRTFTGHSARVNDVAMSPDGSQVVSVGSDGTARLWNATGNITGNVTGGQTPISIMKLAGWGYSAAFHPSGNSFATGDGQGNLQVWDAASGRLSTQRREHSGGVQSLHYSADGQRLLSTGGENTAKLWRTSDHTLLATFLTLQGGAWIVFTPEGYFNTNSADAAKVLTVVKGLKGQALGDFWDVFFRPDLVRRKIAGEDIAKLSGGLTLESALRQPPPRGVTAQIEISAAAPAKGKLAFSIPDAGGGIGQIRIFQNGKLIESTANAGADGSAALCSPSTSKAGGCTGAIDVEMIPGEDNEFSVIAFNATNTVQGLPGKASAVSAIAKREPRLWIFAVGINQFSPQQQSFGTLQNAVNDARSFADAFASRAVGIFAPGNILRIGAASATGAVGQSKAPLADGAATRAAILTGLDEAAANARPEDTFVWFISSHGSITSSGQFGIVPSDIDEARSKLILSSEILEKSKRIRAMTQLFIFDTCHSGALNAGLSGIYDARIASLGRSMGLHLFASAQATETASDSDGNGNGLFTGQLLAALRDVSADLNGDKKLSIAEMGRYAQARTMTRSVKPGTLRGAELLGRQGRKEQIGMQKPLIGHFGVDRDITRAGEP